jgi:hypothetical protein
MPNTQSGKPGLRPAVVGITGLIIITTITLLAGCSSSAQPSSAAGVAAAAPNHAAAVGAAAGFGAKSAAGKAQAATATRLAPAGVQLIYTAEYTVRAKDVTAAISRATTIALAAGGYVAQENASDTPGQRDGSTATLQLKVPAATYPATLSQLTDGQLGTRVALQRQAQDVTQQVADVNSQVTSAEAAIAQLRALLTHAGTVGDLLNVQSEINTEESALETMQAQQKALNGETAFATVTITILSPQPVAKPMVTRPPGLASGITAGWHAFRVSLAWLLAILGAVAPFAAIIAIAGYVACRARRLFLRRPRPGD